MIRGLTALVALLVFATGCWLTSADANEIVAYPLDVAAPAVASNAVAWQLAIDEPVARGPIALDRIVIRDDDGGFSVVARARWSHDAPELVQDAIVRSFEDAGSVPRVVRSSHGVRSDYLLLVELRAFEVDPGTPWAANVVLSAKLMRMGEMKVVAGHVFRARAPAASGTPAIVDAFQLATTRVVAELQTWVVHTGEADWQQRPGGD